MFDINRVKVICEAATMLHNKRGYFNTAAACDFAEKAVVGWPAAIEEIERLRGLIRNFQQLRCARCNQCDRRPEHREGCEHDDEFNWVWAALGEGKA